MKQHFDLAILGSGFSGALLALIARQLGKSVVLLERGRHPRFAMGESSTPLANLLMEELAQRYDLPRLLPLTTWGAWQKAYPQINGGLKRGFTFLRHSLGLPFAHSPSHPNALRVAASPNDQVADTHWFRADFDQFLVREAQVAGACLVEQFALRQVQCHPARVNLEGQTETGSISLSASLVVDATGPRGALAQAFSLPESPLAHLPATWGIYSHFTNVIKTNQLEDFASTRPGSPYPQDEAALHHVFEGGWIWVLHFRDGTTSAGASLHHDWQGRLELNNPDLAWRQLLQRLPSVAAQFSRATPQFPLRLIPRLSYRTRVVAGARWLLLPSAAGFVDPLLSTGFPLSLLGVSRVAEILERHGTEGSLEEPLNDYSCKTNRELQAASLLVGALYRHLDHFQLFKPLSLLYFAAASFAESARRLNRPALAQSFLLLDHPTFAPAWQRCCHRALGPLSSQEGQDLVEEIFRAIEPVDIAGLGDRSKGSDYGVDLHDLLRGADKLGVSTQAVETFVRSLGLS